MEKRSINIAVVVEVARGLAYLKEQMYFIGGAVVSLYADDEAVDEVRPTRDVDMTLKMVGAILDLD